MPKHVVILQEALPSYRAPLFREVYERARSRNIEVSVVCGVAPGARGARLLQTSLAGTSAIQNRYIGVGRYRLVWQPALRKCLQADLVVVEQANRMLINYLLLVSSRVQGRPGVVFWGHGRNLQASPTTAAERLKAWVSLHPNWWFAYTEGVRRALTTRGYPSNRITVVQNTIDVDALAAEVADERQRILSTPQRKCLYLGGLYEHKRLEFLFQAADVVAGRMPDFELHVAGAGEQQALIERLSAERPWAHYWGPVRGQLRARLLATSQLLLVPGMLGLVVLDSFASGVPLVTTADAMHSPEAEYVENGFNGVILDGGASPAEYADVVQALLADNGTRRRLSTGASASAKRYSLSEAAERFVNGLVSAIETSEARPCRA